MHEIEVVKWAAGAVHKPIQNEMVNEEKLFSLLAHHRLTSRFFCCISQERPAWCNRKMHIRAWKAHSQARESMRRQVQAVREVCASLAPSGQPLIVLKGYSTYALTGENHNIRWSCDIDVCFSDLEMLWDALVHLGYVGERRVFSHEFSTVSKRGVSIEVHHYFPVPILPREVIASDMSPLMNPGVWKQEFANVIGGSRIGYEDLAKNLIQATTPEMEGLAVLHPSMNVFISCAHLFRDYHEPTFCRRDPVRLAELADVRDLLRHPQFDEQRLLCLADQFNGHDAVEFTGRLLQTYFSTDSLTASSLRSMPKQNKKSFTFPHLLTWHGCWANRATPHGTDDLLVPSDLRALIDSLGTNTVVASESERQNLYAHPTREGIQAIERVIIQVMRGEPFAFGFSATWSEHVLGFDLHVWHSLDTAYTIDVATEHRDLHHVDVHLGREELTFNSDGVLIGNNVDVHSDEVQLSQRGSGSASVCVDETSFTVRIELPLRIRPRHLESLSLLVLLSVARWDRFPHAVVVVPLKVVQG